MGARLRRERRAQLAARAGRGEVGRLGYRRARRPVAARRPRRQGHDRARLRHGVRLGVARPARRSTGRDRQLGPAARDGSSAPGRARSRLPTDPWQCRGRPVSRCELRSRHLRVRSLDLGGSTGVDPRSGASPPAGRPADLPDQLHAPDAVHAGRGAAGDQRARSPVAGPPSARVGERSIRQLRPGPWRLDSRSSPERIRDREPRRALAGRGCDDGFPYATAEWARKWPTEEVWIARREG